MAKEGEQESNKRYDLGTFVVAVNRLKDQGRPFIVIFTAVSDVVRWKYPFASFLAIPTVLVMIIFCPEYLVGILLIPLPIFMLLNLIKRLGTRKTVTFDHQKFFVRKDESPELIARRNAILKAKEHLDMYLNILIDIQELCNNVSTKLEFFYSLCSWKIWKHSLLFCFLIIGSIIGLFAIRIRFLIAVLLLSLSVFNKGFKKVVKDICSYIYNTPSKIFKSKVDVLAADSSDEDEVENAEEKVQVEEKLQVTENTVDSNDSSDSENHTERPDNKPESMGKFEAIQEKQKEKPGLSFVSKLASNTIASIRRRKPGALLPSSGRCTSCNAEFSAILKKRYYCRHCGHSYCSNCCRQRVPRVVFGATAPAAYEERVLVCNSCYAFLMNRIKGANTEIVE